MYGGGSSVSFLQQNSHALVQVVLASLSDHSPIHTCYRIEDFRNSLVPKRTHSSFKRNSSLLKDHNNVEALVMVIEILRISNPLLDSIDL